MATSAPASRRAATSPPPRRLAGTDIGSHVDQGASPDRERDRGGARGWRWAARGGMASRGAVPRLLRGSACRRRGWRSSRATIRWQEASCPRWWKTTRARVPLRRRSCYSPRCAWLRARASRRSINCKKFAPAAGRTFPRPGVRAARRGVRECGSVQGRCRGVRDGGAVRRVRIPEGAVPVGRGAQLGGAGGYGQGDVGVPYDRVEDGLDGDQE